MIKTIPTGNEEVDRQLAGGIPTPCLMMIEGEHGTGKSALAAQFIQGMLLSKMKVLCVTENTVKDYIEKMKTITFNFTTAFLQNRFSILPLHVYGAVWSQKQSAYLLPVIGRYVSSNSKNFDCVVIDSISLLTMYADPGQILDFLTRCKHLVSTGMTVILTMHETSTPKDISLRIKSACDVYFSLSTASIGGKAVKVMKVIKLIGSSEASESSFAFEIDTNFGIKIVPISTANA
ncbi:MAG: flagellar accessory protein FlaH [Thaumarchaeota archaeon]|nr:flagellar accessory protein FlaH [Nitrososphaerota archaeon]